MTSAISQKTWRPGAGSNPHRRRVLAGLAAPPAPRRSSDVPAGHRHRHLRSQGASRYDGAQRSASPEANLARVRTLEHEFQVLPAGVTIAATFGNLKARMAGAGTMRDDFDLIIASTALAANLTLVSNNERHFKRVEGLRLVNWARE